MTFQTEDELRKARTMQPGEYLAYNPLLLDHRAIAPAPAPAAVYLTDTAPAAAVRFAELVDQARREHAERFAFMGNRAPEFNRDSAEMAARNTIYSEGARAGVNAIRDARYDGHAALSAPAQPGQSAHGDYSPRQVTDALRAARYA